MVYCHCKSATGICHQRNVYKFQEAGVPKRSSIEQLYSICGITTAVQYRGILVFSVNTQNDSSDNLRSLMFNFSVYSSQTFRNVGIPIPVSCHTFSALKFLCQKLKTPNCLQIPLLTSNRFIYIFTSIFSM